MSVLSRFKHTSKVTPLPGQYHPTGEFARCRNKNFAVCVPVDNGGQLGEPLLATFNVSVAGRGVATSQDWSLKPPLELCGGAWRERESGERGTLHIHTYIPTYRQQ